MPHDSESPGKQPLALLEGRGRAYQAYNEEAFLHFLDTDRRRAERAGRSLLLVLIDMKPGAPEGDTILPALVDRLFGALSACVREVDFIGWYRRDRVLGAVLTQNAESLSEVVRRQIGERTAVTISRHLPEPLTSRIRVRVLPLQSAAKD